MYILYIYIIPRAWNAASFQVQLTSCNHQKPWRSPARMALANGFARFDQDNGRIDDSIFKSSSGQVLPLISLSFGEQHSYEHISGCTWVKAYMIWTSLNLPVGLYVCVYNCSMYNIDKCHNVICGECPKGNHPLESVTHRNDTKPHERNFHSGLAKPHGTVVYVSCLNVSC